MITTNINTYIFESRFREEFKSALEELSTLDLEDSQVRIPKFNEDKDSYMFSFWKYHVYLRHKEEIKIGPFEFFILDNDDEVVGFFRGAKSKDYISFNLVYILEDYRGYGIASDVYKYFLNKGITIKSDTEITHGTQSLYLNLFDEGYKGVIYDSGRVGLMGK